MPRSPAQGVSSLRRCLGGIGRVQHPEAGIQDSAPASSLLGRTSESDSPTNRSTQAASAGNIRWGVNEAHEKHEGFRERPGQPADGTHSLDRLNSQIGGNPRCSLGFAFFRVLRGHLFCISPPQPASHSSPELPPTHGISNMADKKPKGGGRCQRFALEVFPHINP